MKRSSTHIATPPGATIKEHLVEHNMSIKEFTLKMDMTEDKIAELINGDTLLTPDLAIRLEAVLGIPSSFWNNLESIYREKLLFIQNENNK